MHKNEVKKKSLITEEMFTPENGWSMQFFSKQVKKITLWSANRCISFRDSTSHIMISAVKPI